MGGENADVLDSYLGFFNHEWTWRPHMRARGYYLPLPFVFAGFQQVHNALKFITIAYLWSRHIDGNIMCGTGKSSDERSTACVEFIVLPLPLPALWVAGPISFRLYAQPQCSTKASGHPFFGWPNLFAAHNYTNMHTTPGTTTAAHHWRPLIHGLIIIPQNAVYYPLPWGQPALHISGWMVCGRLCEVCGSKAGSK